MYTIENNIENTITINKSKFITKLYRIENINDINIILNKLKNEYKDATHICYSYIIDSHEKCDDNGEPNGTAGLPMLNVLKKKNLTNILAVVIRYFGGIKLGAGRLRGAYSNSIVESLKKTNIEELTYGYLIELEFTYDNLKLVDYILCDKTIISKQYNKNIIYNFYINEEQLSFVPELEKIATHVSIKDKKLISCKII